LLWGRGTEELVQPDVALHKLTDKAPVPGELIADLRRRQFRGRLDVGFRGRCRHDRAVCYLVAGRFWLRLPLDAQERKVA
jgi:hypothetical protein